MHIQHSQLKIVIILVGLLGSQSNVYAALAIDIAPVLINNPNDEIFLRTEEIQSATGININRIP